MGERAALVLRMAVAVMITAIAYWLVLGFARGSSTWFIILFLTGFLAGFISGHRLSILVAPITLWVIYGVDTWLHPNPYSDESWRAFLPWNILFTDSGLIALIIGIVPLGFFVWIGWLCRRGIGWALGGNRRPLRELVGYALVYTPETFPRPLALVIDLLALLLVPIIPFLAAPVCVVLLITGVALAARSSRPANRVSGAILSLGALVMVAALVVEFRMFFNL